MENQSAGVRVISIKDEDEYNHTTVRKYDDYLYRVFTRFPNWEDTSPPMPMCDARQTRKTMEDLARRAHEKD